MPGAQAEKPPCEVAPTVAPVTPTKRQLLVAAAALAFVSPEAQRASAERESAAEKLKAVRAGQPNPFKSNY